MDKFKRTERIAAITRLLVESPNRLFTLTRFCDKFSTAKSTMSEDFSIIADAMHKHGLGEIQTLPGAAGGVRFRPSMSRKQAYEEVEAISQVLCDPQRVLAGGFLYWSDVLSSPDIARKMGCIIAGEYYDAKADFVLTMETKGIPVALMTAEALGIPLIIARRSSKVYEGSAVNINYVTARGGIETMALARRAVKLGQKALIVDDFIRGGGTSRGMISLMAEFNVEVVGLAFVLAEDNPPDRHISGEKSLMLFTESKDGHMHVRPAQWLREKRVDGTDE